MKSTKIISVITTLLVSILLGFFSIEALGEYGWTVFIWIPILLGFLPPFIVNRFHLLTKKETYSLGRITLFIACFCLLLFALEGIICIAMAFPLALLFNLLGASIAYSIRPKSKESNSKPPIILMLLISLGFMGFDAYNEPKGLIQVKTSKIIKANIQTVWNNVVSFDTITAPKDWIFETGIAYPTNATIAGRGVGAIRYCNFSTGSFVEPITTWDEPTLLQFTVEKQPIPMNEMNPFWEVHPPHLEGYFNSKRGQFHLTELNETTTKLEGTTWYQIDITPEFYWRIWSDFIIHRIHDRVLNHIKEEAETSNHEPIKK